MDSNKANDAKKPCFFCTRLVSESLMADHVHSMPCVKLRLLRDAYPINGEAEIDNATRWMEQQMAAIDHIAGSTKYDRYVNKKKRVVKGAPLEVEKSQAAAAGS